MSKIFQEQKLKCMFHDTVRVWLSSKKKKKKKKTVRFFDLSIHLKENIQKIAEKYNEPHILLFLIYFSETFTDLLQISCK